jgi:hypothetical protein
MGVGIGEQERAAFTKAAARELRGGSGEVVHSEKPRRPQGLKALPSRSADVGPKRSDRLSVPGLKPVPSGSVYSPG